MMLRMPIWRLQAFDFSRVERMLLQVGINQRSHHFLLEVSVTYGTFLGLLLIFPLLTSQFTPLNLSRSRLWKFGNEGHLVTIKKKPNKKLFTIIISQQDFCPERIITLWHVIGKHPWFLFSPNGNNKNSWPGIQALSRSISVPPIESCLCLFLGRAHSVLKGRPSEETGRNGWSSSQSYSVFTLLVPGPE